MDFNQLTLFLLLAECRQFSEAASRGNISQSSLSKQIKALEDEIGTTLFTRSMRSTELTMAGHEFLVFAKAAVEAKAQMQNNISAFINFQNNETSVGIIPVMASYGIAELLAGFRDKYPSYNLRIIEKSTREIAEMLKNNELNIALTGTGIADGEKYSEHILAYDEIWLAVSAQNPLAQENEVDIANLSGEAFIHLENSIGLNKIIADGLKEVAAQPNFFFRCDTVPSALSLVKEGLGVLLLTEKGIGVFETQGIKLVRLKQKMYGKLVLVTRRNHKPSPVEKAFCDFTLDWYKTKAGTP